MAQILTPQAACAQDQAVAVPETFIEPLQPKGVRLSPLLVAQPRIAMDLRFDDNIYNRSSKEDDVVAVVRPVVRISSDLSRHSVRLDASAESRRYFKNEAENSDQWSVLASGRLDLADRYTLTSQAGIAHRIERRGTFGDQFFTDRPVAYKELSAGASFGRSGAIVEWQVTAGTRKLQYQDATLGGIVLDQSGRDVRRDTASFRLDYRRFGRLSLFGRIGATRLRYDRSSLRGSRGWSVIGGASYQVTDLIAVEAGLGFIRQNSRNPAVSDFKGLDYSLSVNWTPSPRLRITLQGDRSVERSPLLIASSIVQSTILGSIDLAVGTRTIFTLEGGMIRNAYEGADRRETRLFAEAKAKRRLTSQVAGFVGVSARRQTGEGLDARRYSGAAVRLGIDFAF